MVRAWSFQKIKWITIRRWSEQRWIKFNRFVAISFKIEFIRRWMLEKVRGSMRSVEYRNPGYGSSVTAAPPTIFGVPAPELFSQLFPI